MQTCLRKQCHKRSLLSFRHSLIQDFHSPCLASSSQSTFSLLWCCVVFRSYVIVEWLQFWALTQWKRPRVTSQKSPRVGCYMSWAHLMPISMRAACQPLSSGCVSRLPSHHWDKITNTHNLKEEKFILAHSVSGFSPCLINSKNRNSVVEEPGKEMLLNYGIQEAEREGKN